jgi:hypothetical protein
MDIKKLRDTPPWDWPRDTAQTILGILRNDGAEASERLLAAQYGGDFTIVNDEIARALLDIVSNAGESEALRSRAAISLGPALEYADTDGFDEDDRLINEATFNEIQQALARLYNDPDNPKEVRRRILESSARAPRDWHQEAIRLAYASGDDEWRLSAVFCMQFVRGFDEQILQALTDDDPAIRREAVCAAGNWGLDTAWPHIVALLESDDAGKDLLLAAIEAVAGIRPHEAARILHELADSEDGDIAEAALDAMTMADSANAIDDEELDDDEFLH